MKKKTLVGAIFKVGDHVIKKLPPDSSREFYKLEGIVTEAKQKPNTVGAKNWYYKVKWKGGSQRQEFIAQHRLQQSP